TGPDQPRLGVVPVMPCAIFAATAKMVSVGLYPEAVGNTLPSQAYRLSRSWKRPPASTTEVAASFPIRSVPITCLLTGGLPKNPSHGATKAAALVAPAFMTTWRRNGA